MEKDRSGDIVQNEEYMLFVSGILRGEARQSEKMAKMWSLNKMKQYISTI